MLVQTQPAPLDAYAWRVASRIAPTLPHFVPD
jgi:hypothetical protein